MAYVVIPGSAAAESNDLSLAALGPANSSDWIANSKTQPMTPEELSAHVQIMGVQLRHVARKVSVDVDTAPIYAVLETLSRRKLPLLAYSPSPSGNELQAEVETLLRQYAKLVQAQGADGRKLDRKTVDLYSQRVARMMELVGTSNADRIEAVHDLAENTKLLYLLQLNYARSKDSSLNESARQTVLQASNRGLEKLFAEFATGDMRYMDVFLAAEPEEQRELILIRYWCHRIGSVTAANTWLNQMNKLASSDSDDGASILASIAEVDAIENADVEF